MTNEKTIEYLREAAQETTDKLSETEERITALQNAALSLQKYIDDEVAYRDKLMVLLGAVEDKRVFLEAPPQDEQIEFEF